MFTEKKKGLAFGYMLHVCNLNTWEAEAGGRLHILDQHDLPGEFQTYMGY